MSFTSESFLRSCSRKSLWLSLVLLVTTGGPEWLFTIKGCVHLDPAGIAQFNQQMDHDLGGCQVFDHTKVADVYRCGDGGAYMIWWDENKCNAAVADFRAHHQT
jgi:hypothetical protein